MLQSNVTDEDLMSSYQEGSEEAFKELYSRHSGKVLGYLRSRTSSEQDAVDLFQEVFVKIHRSKHLYNRTLPLLPWIFTISHSVLVDGHRKTSRKNEELGHDFDQFAADDEVTIKVDNPFQPLIASLPANQKTALQMRYLDEKTFEEIATSLKTSPMNVRQLISRGIKTLKRLNHKGDRP